MTETKHRPDAATGPAPHRGQQSSSSIESVLRRRSVIGEAAWFRAGTPDQKRVFVHAIEVAKETAQYRRRLVLAHPDLRAALCRLMRYSSPEQWNGYIPPPYNEVGSSGEHWRKGDSPIRDGLLQLVAEAESRETT